MFARIITIVVVVHGLHTDTRGMQVGLTENLINIHLHGESGCIVNQPIGTTVLLLIVQWRVVTPI